jgi:hypothetical protein
VPLRVAPATLLLLVLPVRFTPPASAEAACFTHFESAGLGTQWGTAGPAVGDLEGDGDPDVAISRRETATLCWYETRPVGDGWEWRRHTASAPADPALRKGLEDSLGTAVLDVNGDGWSDVAVNRAWFGNPGGEGGAWARHTRPHQGVPKASYGPSTRTWIVDHNVGTTRSPRFRPVVIHQGRPGWHDTLLVGFDGDGDTDLVSKVWNTGERRHHADPWRNDNPECPASGAGPRAGVRRVE